MAKTLEKNQTESYSKFLAELEKKAGAEAKILLCLDNMRQNLSTEKTPNFRDFWETKRLCLELFKEKLPPRLRTLYWAQYTELSDEIRKLKNILDQQSSFALEQIEMAIDALETDLQDFSSKLFNMGEIELPKGAKSLQVNSKIYIEKQKELDLLNLFAGRLNSLRKELIHTQMRVRHKNRLFEKLSKIGDIIFPKRKESISFLSELFVKDVDSFTGEKFNLSGASFIGLKEEVKALQGFAKILTLNTPAFSQTREKLSGCWDLIRQSEKDHHKKRSEEREKFRENFEKMASLIEALKKSCSEESVTLKEANAQEESILKEMRELLLGRDEVNTLKRRLTGATSLLVEKFKLQQEKQSQLEKLEKVKKLQAQQEMLDYLLEVLDQAEVLPLDVLVEKWDALVKEEKGLNSLGLTKAMLESRLDRLADHIQEKKWQELREENSEEAKPIFHELLEGRYKARRKLKDALEEHRKAVGGSGFSLEQSLLYQELISEEKLRLDELETMIEELEEKLFDIEE